MGIRTRLIIFLLALLTAISILTSVLFIRNELAAISANSQRKNLQILLAMTEVCKEIHGSPGKSYAYRYFKTFLKTPEIVRVSCEKAGSPPFMEDEYYTPSPEPKSRYFKTFSPPGTGTWEARVENGVEILKASFKTHSAAFNIITRVDFSTRLIQQEIESSLRHSSANFFIILSLSFAIGCIGTLIITRAVANPIQAMAEAARRIGSGRLDQMIPVTGKDEMGALASELNDMARKLKESEEIRRDFVSSITHDLRSPVTGIELCADIILNLSEKREYERIPEQVVSINEHSQRLNRFIDSMLEVSRIESGKVTLDIKRINLEDLADRAVRAFRTYASQKGLKLELIVGGDIPDSRGDPDRLYQVLANVVGNAVKFTSSGSVSVFVETAPGGQQVRVCDTGPGINEHELKNIFSKYYRISSGKREYPSARTGTGLGLFIARFIIELHGGAITADSKEGKGSVFSVFLPARAPDL
jgi:signal transduction histidine kinase